MDKPYRKVFQSFIVFWGCMLLLSACGPKDESVQPSPSVDEALSFLSGGGGENPDVKVENNAFYDVASELKDGKFLCMQFFQGEPVQLWASAVNREDSTVSVYMYRQDGTRETCLERIERTIGQKIAYRDSEGYCYSISSSVKGDGTVDSIARLDSAGKALYTARMEGRIRKICELADGRLAMLVYEGSSVRNFDIALLDAEGKFITVAMSEPLPSNTCIGTSGKDLLLMKDENLYRVVLSEEKLEQLFSFALTAYSMQTVSREPNAFRVREDGKLELLLSDRQGSGICETLSLAERDQDMKTVILRGVTAKNQYWLKEQIVKFNSSNKRYQVVLEGTDWNDREAYITSTGVELATGKGPDILMEDVIESPASLIEKGILADLAPLMKQAGIKEEDYFPAAFDTWRMGDSIYSIRFSSAFEERLMSSAVLGDMEDPDIEAVVDAMLAYPENAVYDGYSSAGDILRELLEGSETLWGMVDWENGTCDFGGELFGKLLKAAKRYQYDARNNYPDICSDRYVGSIYNFYSFPTREDARAEGYVPIGMLSDDGGHPVSGLTMAVSLSINANAENKEGAWEFLQFLLSEEIQGGMPDSGAYMPVKKSAFRALAEKEILNGPTNNYSSEFFEGALPRERAEEIEALIGEIRALPFKTEAILEIVLKEAQDYFDGVKEIPKVVDAIENRVGLYLEERK